MTSVCGVALPVAQQVVAGEVGLVAGRHEGGQAETAARGLGDRRDAERAALGGEARRRRRAGRPGRTSRSEPTSGAVLSTPRQFGPTSRIPLARQTASSSAWRSRPRDRPRRSRPRAPRARARRRRRTRARRRTTDSAGTAITASSTGSGTSAIERCAGRPPTVASRGCTTESRPGSRPRAGCAARPRRPSPRGSDTPMTATDAGRRTWATAAAAAIRSRSSKRARASSAERGGQLDVSSPGRDSTSTAKPESRKTWIIRWFSGSTVAVKVSMPSAVASSERCASSTVAMPRPCQSSATSNATSARCASCSRMYAAWATIRSGSPATATSPRPSLRLEPGHVRGRPVEVGAGAEEAQPARLDRRARRGRRVRARLVLCDHRADADGGAVAQRDVDGGGRSGMKRPYGRTRPAPSGRHPRLSA